MDDYFKEWPVIFGGEDVVAWQDFFDMPGSEFPRGRIDGSASENSFLLPPLVDPGLLLFIGFPSAGREKPAKFAEKSRNS